MDGEKDVLPEPMNKDRVGVGRIIYENTYGGVGGGVTTDPQAIILPAVGGGNHTTQT